MPSSPRYRERASKESSSFENAGLERKGVSWMQVKYGQGHGVIRKGPRPVAQPLPCYMTWGKALNLTLLWEMGIR